jgi:hypothetical protein
VAGGSEVDGRVFWRPSPLGLEFQTFSVSIAPVGTVSVSSAPECAAVFDFLNGFWTTTCHFSLQTQPVSFQRVATVRVTHDQTGDFEELALRILPDFDGDGVADGDDVCPEDSDPDQIDSDDDGIGDVCDSCPDVAAGLLLCSVTPIVFESVGFQTVEIVCTHRETGTVLDSDDGLLFQFTYRFNDWIVDGRPLVVDTGPQESSSATVPVYPGVYIPFEFVIDTLGCGRGWDRNTGESVPPPPVLSSFGDLNSTAIAGDDLIAPDSPSLAGMRLVGGVAMDESSVAALNDETVYSRGTIRDVGGLAGFVPE